MVIGRQAQIRRLSDDVPRNIHPHPTEFGSRRNPEDIFVNGNPMRRRRYCERCKDDKSFRYDGEFNLARRKYVRYSCMECGRSVRIDKTPKNA